MTTSTAAEITAYLDAQPVRVLKRKTPHIITVGDELKGTDGKKERVVSVRYREYVLTVPSGRRSTTAGGESPVLYREL